MRRLSFTPMAEIHSALIIRRLYAAEPTTRNDERRNILIVKIIFVDLTFLLRRFSRKKEKRLSQSMRAESFAISQSIIS